jgi:hypothetical protein
VRLGLTLDGFNPFGNMSTSHNTWLQLASLDVHEIDVIPTILGYPKPEFTKYGFRCLPSAID